MIRLHVNKFKRKQKTYHGVFYANPAVFYANPAVFYANPAVFYANPAILNASLAPKLTIPGSPASVALQNQRRK